MFKKVYLSVFFLFIFILNLSYSSVKSDFFFSFFYFFFFVILFLYLRSFDLGRILPLLTAITSSIIFVYGIVQKYILFPIYLKSFNSGAEFLPKSYIERINTGRIFSIFTLPTLYSFICSILLILIFYFLIKSSKIKKFFWFFLFILGLFNLILTQSFSSILYIFAGFSIYLFSSGSLKKQYLAPFLMVLSLFIFIITGTRFSEAKRLEPVKLRISNWKQSVRMIEDHPYFGVGMGNYKNMISKYIKDDEAKSIYAHNFFLQFVAENGIFLTIFLLFLIIFNLKKWIKTARNPNKILLPIFVIFILYNSIDIGIYFFSSALIGTILLSQMFRSIKPPSRISGIALLLISLIYSSLYISSTYSIDGGLLLNQKKYIESMKKFKKSTFLNKFDYRNYSGIATLNLIQKNFNVAEKNIDLSLKLNHESGYSHYIKSKICQIKKKYFTALWHAFIATKLNDNNKLYKEWYQFLQSGLDQILKNGETAGEDFK